MSPKRLGLPAPTPAEIQRMVAVAANAPDHGRLKPWRFIEVPTNKRAELADLFATRKLLRQPAASADTIARERDKAFSAPALIAVCACLRYDNPAVPTGEQLVCIGAAIQGFLLGAHGLGYGGIILSGERVRDPWLGKAFGLGNDESLVGFISVGTTVKALPTRKRPALEEVHSIWQGCDVAG